MPFFRVLFAPFDSNRLFIELKTLVCLEKASYTTRSWARSAHWDGPFLEKKFVANCGAQHAIFSIKAPKIDSRCPFKHE